MFTQSVEIIPGKHFAKCFRLLLKQTFCSRMTSDFHHFRFHIIFCVMESVIFVQRAGKQYYPGFSTS